MFKTNKEKKSTKISRNLRMQPDLDTWHLLPCKADEVVLVRLPKQYPHFLKNVSFLSLSQSFLWPFALWCNLTFWFCLHVLQYFPCLGSSCLVYLLGLLFSLFWRLRAHVALCFRFPPLFPFQPLLCYIISFPNYWRTFVTSSSGSRVSVFLCTSVSYSLIMLFSVFLPTSFVIITKSLWLSVCVSIYFVNLRFGFGVNKSHILMLFWT